MMRDPRATLSLEEHGGVLRGAAGRATELVAACLARIAALDPALGAFEEIDAQGAMEQAAAVERGLRAGQDRGALMGVPVAVKDLFAVTGTQVHAGSRMRVDDLVGPEGSFIRRLRALGCVFIGKTRTTEFAFSPSGINAARGTPRNPRDAAVFRIPGGSSSGSAVAVAAGLCPLAIGSDTGGSIRVPAALTGIVGLKTSVGLWPTDGVFSLSSTLDTIGLLGRSVADIALAFATIVDAQRPAPRQARGLRLGLPRQYFRDNLDADVATAFDAALGRLERAGVSLVPVDLPEAAERQPLIGKLLGYEVLAHNGRARLAAALPEMDPLVRTRIAAAMSVTTGEYAELRARQRQIEATVTARLAGLDGWISPTVPCTAPALADCGGVEQQGPLNLRLTQNTQPGNLFGACGLSLPLPGAGLPVGFQLLGVPGSDAATIEVAAAIEPVLAAD